MALQTLVGLPEVSPLWRWQPTLRYHLIDAGAFSAAKLEAHDVLPALWFRLEEAANPAQVVIVADAVLAWLARHPGFEAARAAFVDLLAAMVVPLGPDIRVPQDLLELRNMLATRTEQWKPGWLLEGRQEGRQEGEAALLLRLLGSRFGALPPWVGERLRGADIATLEAWGLRILEAGTLENVLGGAPG